MRVIGSEQYLGEAVVLLTDDCVTLVSAIGSTREQDRIRTMRRQRHPDFRKRRPGLLGLVDPKRPKVVRLVGVPGLHLVTELLPSLNRGIFLALVLLAAVVEDVGEDVDDSIRPGAVTFLLKDVRLAVDFQVAVDGLPGRERDVEILANEYPGRCLAQASPGQHVSNRVDESGSAVEVGFLITISICHQSPRSDMGDDDIPSISS